MNKHVIVAGPPANIHYKLRKGFTMAPGYLVCEETAPDHVKIVAECQSKRVAEIVKGILEGKYTVNVNLEELS